jgi:hypothetical protein
MRAHHQGEPHYFNAQACQHEGDPRRARRKQSQRSQNQAPTGQQQQKTENLHEGRPPRATYLLLRGVSLASASKPIQPIFAALQTAAECEVATYMIGFSAVRGEKREKNKSGKRIVVRLPLF